MTWRVAAVLLAAAAGELGAQGCEDPARFTAASARYRHELADLYATRGMPEPLPPPGELSIGRFTSLLDEHYGHDGDQVAVLLYSADAERLTVWLISHRGLLACADVDDGVPGLDRAASRLRSAAGVDAGAGTAQAHDRGLVAPTGSEERPSLDRSVRELTDIVLPHAIRRELSRFPALVVVPVRSIGTVPFAMLRPFSPDRVLAEHASIAIAPSMYDLFQLVPSWSPPRSALVIGNPTFAAHPRFVLPSLSGAEQEARQVAQEFGTEPHVGASATKARVLTAVGSTSPHVLHFATHGVADPADPLDGSFLALAASEGDAGWWTAREIQGTRFPGAQLAILSACQTGLGAAHDAGIIGLARAFQLAGVPRVVVSLWNVDDAATTAFMTQFARAVLVDSPNNALQATILRIREQHPDPKVWAAFVLFGTVR